MLLRVGLFVRLSCFCQFDWTIACLVVRFVLSFACLIVCVCSVCLFVAFVVLCAW